MKKFNYLNNSGIKEYFLFLRGANLSISLDHAPGLNDLIESISKITSCRLMLNYKTGRLYKILPDS